MHKTEKMKTTSGWKALHLSFQMKYSEEKIDT